MNNWRNKNGIIGVKLKQHPFSCLSHIFHFQTQKEFQSSIFLIFVFQNNHLHDLQTILKKSFYQNGKIHLRLNKIFSWSVLLREKWVSWSDRFSISFWNVCNWYWKVQWWMVLSSGIWWTYVICYWLLCTAKAGRFHLISLLLINAEVFIAYRAVFDFVFYRIRCINSRINYSSSMWTAACPTIRHA